MIPFLLNNQNRKVHRDRTQIVDAQGSGAGGNREQLLNG